MVETGNVCVDIPEAEDQYTWVGWDGLLSRYASIYWPSLFKQEVRSPGGVLHWARCTEAFEDFTRPNSKIPRQVTLLIDIYVRDHYLRANRSLGGGWRKAQAIKVTLKREKLLARMYLSTSRHLSLWLLGRLATNGGRERDQDYWRLS